MTRKTGYALPAGLAALVVLVSTAIFVGAGNFGSGSDAAPQRTEATAPASAGSWVGTWTAPAASAEPDSRDGHADTSQRNVVHTSVGGSRARIHVSNLFGNRPLTVSHATLALAAAPSSPTATAGSMRTLSFDGSRSVDIPAGERVASDPVRMNVPAAADLLVTLHTPQASGPATYHPHARQTNYVAVGDRADETSGSSYTEQTPFWRYVTAVDVWNTGTEGAVVVLGDSLTDSITSSPGANRRWTDFLADRLRTERGAPRFSVLNAGISGNRILIDGRLYSPDNGPSALSRAERDVFSRTGARTMIVELGLNDILKQPQQLDADVLVSGLRELARRAHARGLRAVGGTLTPFGGHAGITPRMEAVRQDVNERIRSGDVFDAVIDFDAVLRDPAHPRRLRTAYDSGDHLHPNDTGYRAMAEAAELAELKGGAEPARL